MKDFFKSQGIEFYSLIPLNRCKILKGYLLEKNGFSENDNAILFLIPYRSEKAPVNLTVYASVPDYHRYVENLSNELNKYVKSKYPHGNFKLFADHSPIDEVHASCISGLGFIGDNGLLINEKYSSFVFLAECVTNLTDKELGLEYAPTVSVNQCLHCGACHKACPSNCIGENGKPKTECLSAITQKKGSLSEGEIKMMLENGSIWGCDVCQNVCPYTKNASFTPIEYFKNDVITLLDSQLLDSLSDEEFKKRPFAWRGREVIKRNVEIYERSKND
ncbi:MAG: epoxyqueuosine reductase [Clostridia bacterium]|nr:epoxyqueuosine reductase [Clostridia bacterium]